MSSNLIGFSIIFEEDLSAGIRSDYGNIIIIHNTSLFMDDEHRKEFQNEMKSFLRDFFDAKVKEDEYF